MNNGRECPTRGRMCLQTNMEARQRNQRTKDGEACLLHRQDGQDGSIYKFMHHVHCGASEWLPNRQGHNYVGPIIHASRIKWRDDYLKDMDKGVPKYTMLEAYFETLKEEFSDPDKRLTKIYKLRTLVQGNHTANEHVQTFKKAVWGTGYYGNMLIEEFKRSLHPRLRECISNLNNIPETIEGWYHQAMHLDRQ
jgi:hypothetical protein